MAGTPALQVCESLVGNKASITVIKIADMKNMSYF